MHIIKNNSLSRVVIPGGIVLPPAVMVELECGGLTSSPSQTRLTSEQRGMVLEYKGTAILFRNLVLSWGDESPAKPDQI